MYDNEIIRGHWNARAEYADGTVIDRDFAYREKGNANLENERQYSLECWLMDQHDDITWYSVDFVAD